MAQTWSKSLICQGGLPQPTNKRSALSGAIYDLAGYVILSCAGPVTSVAAGSTLDVSAYFDKCYGGFLSRTGGEGANYSYYLKPTPSTFAAATLKVVVLRNSNGDQLPAATNLSAEKLLITLWGC